MRSFAIDIETMGTDSSAAMTAVGVVEFHHDEDNEAGDGPRIDREFYAPLHLATSIDAGGTMDAETVLWWMKEDLLLARRKWMFSPLPIRDGLEAMRDWMQVGGNGAECLVYARGPQFDCVIIRETMARLGLVVPWGFRNERDTRTMCKMYPSIVMPEDIAGSIKHFALDDARYEALTVWNLWKHLNARP